MSEQQNDNPTSEDPGLPEADRAKDHVSHGGRAENMYVIGIGASAGGLEALERFFRAMPTNTGNAFAVVQHQSPDFKSLMSELLERFTDMPVITVHGPEPVKPDHIYLVPPGKELVASDTNLLSRERRKDGVLFLPINSFFRSLAANWGDQAVAIVLSGTGSDGSNGALDVRDAGGVVIAENPETARFDGMPRSVINSGSVDAVLAPEEMAGFIANELPTLRLGLDSESPDPGDQEGFSGGIPAILEMLRKRYQIDFNFYKPRTIIRRIERRLLLGGEGTSVSLEEYSKELSENPDSLNQLYKDLLIGVTRFFRDAEAFQVIEKKVIPAILADLQPGEEIRVWDCGCSTGEEAYSLAILFLEALRAKSMSNSVKILATDLHESSLQSASQGIYAANAMGEISEKLRERYFENLGENNYRVLPELRKCIIFTRHNVLNDPPFTKLHMIACRNLLIYLNVNAQRQVLASFQYSLVAEGMLFLGASESLGEINEAFDTVERQWKVYRKRHGAPLIRRPEMPKYIVDRPATTSRARKTTLLTKLYDQLLERFMPPGVLIGGHNEIIHIFGDVTNYMSPVGGRFTGDLTSLLAKPLQMPLITAMRNAEKTGTMSKMHGIQFDDTGHRVQLSVEPLHTHPEEPHNFLVLFHLQHEPLKPKLSNTKEQTDIEVEGRVRDYIQDLENELKRTRESLQSAVEELETSNEELQASNEELLASNEELQSTNEELHSVNEELYSVNAEHESKIQELSVISSDLKNLMDSTDTATLFVDREMHIRLFTPRVQEIFSLLRQDIGRDLRHFQPRIPDFQLITDVETVMQGGEPIDTYVLADQGVSYLRRCMVYADATGEQVGVVINYTDVSEVFRARKERAESEERFKLILRNAPSATLLVDEKQRIQLANEAACNLVCADHDALVGQPLDSLFVMTQPGARATLQELLRWREEANGTPACRLLLPEGDEGRGPVPIEVRAGYLRLDEKPHIVLLVTDLSEREKHEQNQERALQAATELADARSAFLANMSHELRTPLSGLLGFVQLGLATEEAAHSPELKEMFQRMIACGEQLQAVVDAVLDFSRLEDGKLRLHPETVDIKNLMTNCLNAVRPIADGKRLSLVSDLNQLDGIKVNIDPLRFSEVIMNLLSNAVKFTEHGEVRLRASCYGDVLDVEIIDTGIGIPPEHHQRIFEPFEQVDTSSTRVYGGTGLGLSISKRLVNEFGGTLTLQSAPGQGSTFHIRVPCTQIAQHEAAQPQRHDAGTATGAHAASAAVVAQKSSLAQKTLEGYSILLVEDDPDNQTVIKRQLELYGAVVRAFDDGQSLLDAPKLVKQEASLVLMDIQLPGMDGYETAHELSKDFPDLPVIALTAHAFEENRERSFAAGMRDHITKPLQMPELIRAIRRYKPVRNRR